MHKAIDPPADVLSLKISAHLGKGTSTDCNIEAKESR